MIYVSILVQTVTTVAVKYSDFGVNVAEIFAYKVLDEQFEVFPSDIYYQTYIGVATEGKE